MGVVTPWNLTENVLPGMSENFAITKNTWFEDQIVPDKDITLPSDGSLNFVSNWASYVSEFVSFENNIHFSASRKKI